MSVLARHEEALELLGVSKKWYAGSGASSPFGNERDDPAGKLSGAGGVGYFGGGVTLMEPFCVNHH